MEGTQPNGVKPKIRERKSRRGVNWQGALKAKWGKTRAGCAGIKNILTIIWQHVLENGDLMISSALCRGLKGER